VIRRSFRFGLAVGLLGGLAFALVKMLGSRQSSAPSVPETTAPWPPLTPDATPPPERATVVTTPAEAAPAEAAPVEAASEAPAGPPPAPAEPVTAEAAPAKPATKKAAAKRPPAEVWVLPTGDVCPTTHPVKAKLTSKIFHLPGMLNYERTHPDRCYRDPQAAEADGLRPAKR
jgi:hypothetical protein